MSEGNHWWEPALTMDDFAKIRAIVAVLPKPENHDIFMKELIVHIGRLRRELACDTQGDLSEKTQSDIAIMKRTQALILDYCRQNAWPFYPGISSHEELVKQRWEGAKPSTQEQDDWKKIMDLQRLSFAVYHPLKELIGHLESMAAKGTRGKKEIDAKINSFLAAIALLFDHLLVRPTTTPAGPFYTLAAALLEMLGERSDNPRRRVERAIRSLKTTKP